MCENSKLNLVMRNNINGDFSIVEKISELKPGAFININWNKKKIMLPYSLRKDYISFTDKKWDWGMNLIRTDRLILIIPLYTNYYLLERLKHIFVKQKLISQTYNFKISILDFLTSELLFKDEQSKKPK